MNYLQQNDKVAIVAPSRKVSLTEIAAAIDEIKSWGLVPVFSKNLFAEKDQFAGDDTTRAKDFQWAMDNEEIKAIFCARGGYGAVRIVDKLDFSKFIYYPKPIIGFSDTTVLHCKLQSLGIESIHAPLLTTLTSTKREHIDSLKTTLMGQANNTLFVTEDDEIISKKNRNGNGYGVLVGGNLSLLYSILGSDIDINTDGKVLFIEDLDEYLYHIDRMIVALKRAGKFDNLKGLIVGSFSDMHDNEIPFGKNAYEIIFDNVAEYSFPIIFNFPAGHGHENLPLIMGRTVEMNVSDSKVEVRYIKDVESFEEQKAHNSIFKMILYFLIFFVIIWLIYFIFSKFFIK